MKDPDKLKQTTEYAVLKPLAEALNNYGFNTENFVESIALLHPTIQQRLFRLIKVSALYMAFGQIRIDDRNRASFEMCEALAPILCESHLPHI